MWRIRQGRVEAGRRDNHWSPDLGRSHSPARKLSTTSQSPGWGGFSEGVSQGDGCPGGVGMNSARASKDDPRETWQPRGILKIKQGFFRWEKRDQALLPEGAVDAKEWEAWENVIHLRDTKHLEMVGCLGLRWPWWLARRVVGKAKSRQTLGSLTCLWFDSTGRGL